MKKINIVELLYFSECASWKEAEKLLQEVLKELKINIDILMINVKSKREALKYLF